jgi:hypothetical protein
MASTLGIAPDDRMGALGARGPPANDTRGAPAAKRPPLNAAPKPKRSGETPDPKRPPPGPRLTPAAGPAPHARRRARNQTYQRVWRYVLRVSDEPTTEELKLSQLERERAERRRAEAVPDDEEAAQHERRADKARYLAEKLEERAESERRHED